MTWAEFLDHIHYVPSRGQKLIRQAFELSMRAHEGQTRQSGEPFAIHPIATAQILAGLGADTDTLVAALLHDTVEDTEVTLSQIEKLFGRKVATLIDGVTKLEQTDLAQKPTLDEKIETMRKMFTLMQEDIRIMLIKLADRLHNMRTISFRPLEKQRLVAKETMDVYVKIADRLCMRALRDEMESLCRAVLEPELHAILMEVGRQNFLRSGGEIASMKHRVQTADPTLPFDAAFEPKTWENLLLQYELQREADHPIIQQNIVVRCRDVAGCYRTLGVLHQLWPSVVLSFEDFINVPAVNGYKGLHTTVILENGVHMRCKIRTFEMDAFARKGIATVCFDTKHPGMENYLSWTKHISPLSNDTQFKSKEFWSTLQSDILSESIVVYGTENTSVLLPKGATALDGALYLYPDTALRLTAIRVNGHEVPFTQQIDRADLLEITTGDAITVKREWLHWVCTGLGVAMIRNVLTNEKRGVKIREGRAVLEEYLRMQRRGSLAEFNPVQLTRILKEKGFSGKLDDIYIQLAEGRVLPQEIEMAIFHKRTQGKGRRKSYKLQCTIPQEHWNTFHDLLQQYQAVRLRAVRNPDVSKRCMVRLLLTEEERNHLLAALQQIARQPVRLVARREYFLRGTASMLLFVLWGIDPVLAHQLLNLPSVDPLNLTVVRFFSFAVVSGLCLWWIRSQRPLPETRLSLRNPSLWLSAIFLFIIAIATYYSLLDTLPSHYTIPMAAADIAAVSYIINRRHTALLSWLIALCGILLLIFHTPGWKASSIGFTMLASVTFAGFALISEGYKRRENISLRTGQYLAVLALLCALFSLTLLPFTDIFSLPPSTLLLMILFSVSTAILPYYVYYYLLSHREIDFLLRYSFLIIPVTLLAQYPFVGSPSSWTLLASLFIAAGGIVALLKGWHLLPAASVFRRPDRPHRAP